MDPVSFIFTPGIASTIYLPINGSEVAYESKLDIGVSGAVTLSACYDKYGMLWKWSTLEANSLTGINGLSALRVAILSANNTLSSTNVIFPSSWSTTQCYFSAGSNAPGDFSTFPKKWRSETPLSASYFNINTQSCSSIGVYWTLSSKNWRTPSPPNLIPLSVSNTFTFDLKLLDYGTTYGTVNFYDDTYITLNAQAFVDCMDPLGNISATYINQTFELTAVAPPDAKVYTPNRYVLTGTNVNFENLIARSYLVTSLTANCDDGKVIVLSDTDVTKNFSVTYDVIGFKNITITLDLDKTIYGTTAPNIVATFPNLVQVLSKYDEVSEKNFRSTSTPLIIPWKSRPHVGINDWVTEDNINSCIKKFYENLEYLNTLGKIYPGTYSDYYGYLGVGAGSTVTGNTTAFSVFTWEDVDCLNSSLPYDSKYLTWREWLSAGDIANSGEWVKLNNATWLNQTCSLSTIDPSCTGKYCVGWNWRSRKVGNSLKPITWKQTMSASDEFPKRWYFEPCDQISGIVTVCDEGYWNVNIPKLDTFYNERTQPAVQLRCIYYGVASKNNTLFLAQKTQIKVLNSDYAATVSIVKNTTDPNSSVGFSNIKNICLDSAGKIYVLDNILSQVFVYVFPSEPKDFKDTPAFTSWGGYGTAASNTKFSNPNDIHIDQLDNVWICDTGNNVIKHYSNTGTWLKTIRDEDFKTYPPLSLAVDSKQNVHVLTSNGIRVYTYDGIFSYSYSYKEYVTSNTPIKLNTSYNREIVYVAFKTQVIKFFRTGVFAGYIIQSKEYVNNINGMFHDEYRNLLVIANDRVYKYPDIMTLKQLKGPLPSSYWKLEDLLIHKEEYVQNWVYTKSFQRLWDNIEIFRNTLQYSTGNCKSYTSPLHSKDKMIIGQNEIVTSTVVNRVLGYLWDNFYTMVKYFDPSCEN
jgi:hypothetical protein